MKILVLNYFNSEPVIDVDDPNAFTKEDCEIINEDIGIHVKLIMLGDTLSTIALLSEKDDYTTEEVCKAIESFKAYVINASVTKPKVECPIDLTMHKAYGILINIDRFIIKYREKEGTNNE